MKLLSLFILFIIPPSVFGQHLSFKGSLVDTLKIISNSGYYHFDSCGTTTGVYDVYLIVFDESKNSYITDAYTKTEYKTTFRPDTSSSNTTIIKTESLKDQSLISNLLKQFETPYKKPVFSTIGLKTEEFRRLTGKKQILKVAKWNDVKWHFDRKYSTKKQNNLLFKNCQNIDTFNLYLSTAFDTTGYVFVTDVDVHFEVFISTEKCNYLFEGKYPNPYKQPWYDQSTANSIEPTSILNFSINTAIVNLLPRNFSRLNDLKFETLTDDFIEWYLKRRNMLF